MPKIVCRNVNELPATKVFQSDATYNRYASTHATLQTVNVSEADVIKLFDNRKTIGLSGGSIAIVDHEDGVPSFTKEMYQSALENHLAVFKPGFPLNDKLSHEVEFHDFLSTLDPEFTGITVSSTTSFREWCLAQEGGKYISPWESGTHKAE